MSGLTFDDLVTTAALGVSRKGFAPAELDGVAAEYAGRLDTADPAAALLDAAALLTVAGRAGVRLADGTALPVADPGDRTASPPGDLGGRTALPPGDPGDGAERELSMAGARALTRLSGRDRSRRSAANAAGVTGDLLAAMRDAGYVLPAPLLADLLDLASRTPVLRPAVAPVLGTRGRWLSRHRADWQEVADAATPEPDGSSAPGDRQAEAMGDREAGAMGDRAAGAPGDPEVWRVGRPAERRGYLARLRDCDPGAGRELLFDGWTRESKEDRSGLLGMLGRGLSAADEEFLENALGDRAAEVRAVARRLLARLPDSAFQRRASLRAAQALRLEGNGTEARLVAYLPRVLDKASLRDGVDSGAPPGWNDDAGWLLAQLVAGAPPSELTTRLRMTSAQLVALPVAGAAAIDVRAGWRLAVARQAEAVADAGRNGPGPAGPELAEWAAALLDADRQCVNRPPSVWVPDAALAGLLPGDARATRTAALLDAVGKDARPPQAQRVMAELAGHRIPWPALVADAALAALDRAAGRPLLTEFTQALLDAAGRAMPASGVRDYAAELTRLAVATPEAMPWMPAMRAAAETITLRRAFLAELRDATVLTNTGLPALMTPPNEGENVDRHR
ncbi:hypothetical protein EAS64_14735 [Trebonia kvetii]|uniref:Uncharacterized protein n=1 Tax=Trebonia kvetii TaxID=2480626 RepID=A0A6P2C884_9ACTN|nr:DUF5691 domain-containing protein [Trebonia kvetii]TVZ05743.1 hypothetical protein EAS64_14735 [Trebonia kvetii]